MKEIILSADGKAKIYSAPDEVANNLEKYCIEFTNWIWKNPNGAKLIQVYNGQKMAMFDESDFVDYLNEWVFPEQQTVLIKELDSYYYEIPKEYRVYPQFNF